MEDQPFKRSRRLQTLPLLTIVEPPLPPKSQRLDIDGSNKLVGISEVLGEPELRANHLNLKTVEVKDL